MCVAATATNKGRLVDGKRHSKEFANALLFAIGQEAFVTFLNLYLFFNTTGISIGVGKYFELNRSFVVSFVGK